MQTLAVFVPDVGSFICERREGDAADVGRKSCGRPQQIFPTSGVLPPNGQGCLQLIGRDKTCVLQRFGKRFTRRKPDVELGDFTGSYFLLCVAAFAVAR